MDLLLTQWTYEEANLWTYKITSYKMIVSVKSVINSLDLIPDWRKKVIELVMIDLSKEKDKISFYEFMNRFKSSNVLILSVYEWKCIKYYSRKKNFGIASSFWNAIYSDNASKSILNQDYWQKQGKNVVRYKSDGEYEAGDLLKYVLVWHFGKLKS